MKTALVTGCNGFIGSHLVEELLKKGIKVYGVDISPYQLKDEYPDMKEKYSFNEIQGDLTDQSFVNKLIANTKPDTIFHLASIVGVNTYIADPLKVIDVSITSTRNLIHSIQNNPIRFLFSSTSEIYGKNPNVPWNEETDRVLGPTTIERWSYSTSKAVAEHMLLAASKSFGLPVTIVRYFNVYGPRQRPDLVVPAIIKNLLSGLPLKLYDTGNQTRCFTYVKDAVIGTILAASHEKAIGHVFNIGIAKETSIKDLADEVIKQLQVTGNALTDPVNTKQIYSDSYQDIFRRVPVVSKVKDMLGWEATTSLEEGLAETIKWWKRNINISS